MSFNFADLPSFVKTAKDLYSFGKEIKTDIEKWQEKKQKRKLKKILTDLRNLIGSIDQIYSELLLLDRISSLNQREFEKNKKKFEKFYDQIQTTRNILCDIVRLDYFYNFPEIRDVLFIKISGEVETEPGKPWPKPEPKPSENLKNFQRYVELNSITTRKALVIMNHHLEEKFS